MTAWARLTWQAADPAALALELATRLGPGAIARAEPGRARVVHLDDGDLDLVPWRRETADDHPRPAGRLVFEPLDHADLEPDAVGEGVIGGAVLVLAASVLRLAGIGWATVELDRAEAELDPWLDPVTVAAAANDETPEPHLGARTRVRRSPGLPGEVLILAEPVAEGRLAASLARDGEGPCAMYLEPAEGLTAWRAAAATRGIVTSTVQPGPLGPSVLLTGAPSGPHLIVVDRRRHPIPCAGDRPTQTPNAAGRPGDGPRRCRWPPPPPLWVRPARAPRLPPPATPLWVTGAMDERGSGPEPRGSTFEPSVSTPLVTHVGVTGTVPRGE